MLYTSESAFKAFSISPSMTNPFGDISGSTDLPASVISPRRSILRRRSLFNSDYKLPFLRGASFWAVAPLSIFFVVLSIQPKHMASSTESIYQKVPSSTGRSRFTITQHSFSLLWLFMSHSLSSWRFFASEFRSGNLDYTIKFYTVFT